SCTVPGRSIASFVADLGACAEADLSRAWQLQLCAPESCRNSRQRCLTTQVQPIPEAEVQGYQAFRETRLATKDPVSRRWGSRRRKLERSAPVPLHMAGVLSGQGRN